MLDDYYSGFREHLQEGMRIEIGIPLSGGGIFRDWAIVSESHRDELLAQLSRDVLPANVRVEVGFILDVCVWIKKEAYTCSAIVTEKLGSRVLRIRLFGSFTLRERRQFFRIGLNLRIRYAPIRDGLRNDIERDWAQRRDLEHMKFQGYDDFVISAHQARYAPAIELDWQELPWPEVNLGGGGIRLPLPEPPEVEQLLALEIHLPLTPPRQVHAVAQVIHVMSPKALKGGGFCCNAGAQFLLLDERDRDLIFQHISVAQIAHLREEAEKRDFHPGEPAGSRAVTWEQVVRRSLWTLLLLVLLFYVLRSLLHYEKAGPENEIRKTYEKSIKRYRHQAQ